MDRGAECYRRFLEGDESGFVALVEDYRDGLILYLNCFVQDIATAEELAEDTFVKLGLRRPRDTGRASFKTWLYAIGRNVARDHLRRVARRGEVPLSVCETLSADEETLEEAVLRQERAISLHRAMRRLSPTYQQVLWLIYFEEFTHKEAAQVMGRSVHSVETLAYRARRALKDELCKGGFVYEEL